MTDNTGRPEYRICAIEQCSLPDANVAELRACAQSLWATLETFSLIKNHHGELREVTYKDGRAPSFVIFVDEQMLFAKSNIDWVKQHTRSFIAGWIAGNKYRSTVKKPRSKKSA